MAVWNGARHLRAALDSVLAQSRPVEQFVVVDDGSTDETPSILAGYGHVLCVVRQDHAGQARALNAGIDVCTGDLITFCDADDLLTPEAVATRLPMLETDAQLDAVFGRVEQFVSPEVPEELARTFRFPAGPVAARVPGTMVARRDVFTRFGRFDESRVAGSAIAWLAQAGAAGLRAVDLDALVLRRRLHETNLSRTTGRDGNRDLLAVVREHRRRRIQHPERG